MSGPDAEQLVQQLADAARSGDVREIESILNQGVDVNAKDKHSTSPLFAAVFWGRLGAVRVLLRHKANLNDKDNYGDTALTLAATVVKEKKVYI